MKNPRISPRADTKGEATKQSREYGVEVFRYTHQSLADAFRLCLSRFGAVGVGPKLLLRNSGQLFQGGKCRDEAYTGTSLQTIQNMKVSRNLFDGFQ